MDKSCLAHILTSEQRGFFETKGYVVIPDALDDGLRERLIAVSDRVDARERTPEIAGKLLSVNNVVREDGAMVELVNNPKIFPKVWGVLGWNIYLYHSHMDSTPPENANLQNWSVAWHQDSMRVNDEIESNPRPRLSLKVGYYLTDVSEPGRGNTLVLPGSHLQNELDLPQDGRSSPEGAVPVLGPAGCAVLLDRRTWHSRSANVSNMTRKVIW